MPREVFVAGQILTAAELNTVSDQTVMTFAGTAARGSAIPTPVEGMISYLEDSNQWEGYTTQWGPLGRILQVVTGYTASSTSTTSTNFVNTSLSASITPKSTSSQIAIFVQVKEFVHLNSAGNSELSLFRGTVSGTQLNSQALQYQSTSSTSTVPASLIIVDSPSTISSTTYTLGLKTSNASNTASISGAQNIILMEVAG